LFGNLSTQKLSDIYDHIKTQNVTTNEQNKPRRTREFSLTEISLYNINNTYFT